MNKTLIKTLKKSKKRPDAAKGFWSTRKRPDACPALCPGCRWIGVPYSEQLGEKFERLNEAFSGFDPIQYSKWTQSLEPSPLPWRYRARGFYRAQIQAGRFVFGLTRKLKAGYPEFEVIEIPICPVQTEALNRVLVFASGLLAQEIEIPIFGLILDEQSIGIVIKSRFSESTHRRISELFATQSIAVWINWNPSAGDRVVSPKHWQCVHGPRQGTATFPPGEFSQVHSVAHQRALTRASDFLRMRPGDSVLDLYSGGGRSVRLWQSQGAGGLAIELSGTAVERLRPSLNPSRFEALQGRVVDRLPQIDRWLGAQKSPPMAYLNPPREGLETAVVQKLSQETRLVRMAYLSCQPRTLARDLDILVRGNWDIEALIPFDFFPQTPHLEVLALLKFRRNP